MTNSPTLNQIHYRFRTDAGAVDATPTWGAAEDVPFFPGEEVAFRIRFRIQNTGTAAGAGPHIPRLFKNGVIGPAITTSSTGGVQSADASSSADAAAMATANFRLTTGTGTALAGVYDENGSTTLSITNGFQTELEYGFIVKSANVVAGDVLDLRVYDNTTAYTTYGQTARIVIPEDPGTNFVFDRLLGSNGSITANQASIALTSQYAVAAGSLVVIVVACDNNQTTDGDEGAVTSISSSVGGNTWTKAVEFCNGQALAQAGATVSIWYSQLTNPLVVGSTITANLSNSASRDAVAITGKSWTVTAGKIVMVEGTATLANDAADPGSLNVTTANIECLRVRGTAMEYTGVVDITTSNTTTWGPFPRGAASTGTAATSMAVYAESFISTGTGQASDPTIAAADCASAYVAFRADTLDKTLTATKWTDTVESFGTATKINREIVHVKYTDTVEAFGTATKINRHIAGVKYTDTVESFGVPVLAVGPAPQNRYWVGGGSSTSWTAVGPTNWSATSGGPNNASVPTSIDDVFFNASSGSAVTWPTGQSVRSIDFNGYTGTLTFQSNVTFTITGNGGVCRFSSAMTIAAFGTATQLTFTGTSGVMLLTTNGKAIPPIIVNGVGGTVQLQDAFTPGNGGNGNGVTVTAGFFDANDFNVSLVGSFASAGSLVRRIDMGSGQWRVGLPGTTYGILAGLALSGTNITLNCETSSFVVAEQVGIALSTRITVSPGGLTFNDFHIYGATIDNRQVAWTTAGVINTLTLHGPNLSLDLSAGFTTTSLVFAGTSKDSHVMIGNLITGQGVLSITQASGTVVANWCVIVNISATGGATFTAPNSVGIRDNPGWTITPPPV